MQTSETHYTKLGDSYIAGSEFRFSALGMHRLKGVPDEWQLYSVTVL